MISQYRFQSWNIWIKVFKKMFTVQSLYCQQDDLKAWCQHDDLSEPMFTLVRTGGGSVGWIHNKMCQTSLTCTLVPTKNKSLVLCQPIVLAPVFVFILPPLQKLCFILQHFYTAQLLCYCADNTEFTGGTKNMHGNNKLVPTPKQHSELSTSSVKLS